MKHLVKVEVVIDTTQVKQIAALSQLLAIIGEAGPEQTETILPVNKTTETAPPEKQIRATKEVPKQEVKAPEPEEPATEEAEETTAEETEGPKLEEIREVLGKKVTEHREAIKAMLTKLGAKNVSMLDAKYYVEFYTFLNKL